MEVAVVALAILCLALALVTGAIFRRWLAVKAELVKYQDIRDVEAHRSSVAAETDILRERSAVDFATAQQCLVHLQGLISQGEQHLAQVRAQVAAVEDDIEMESFGLYHPRFDLDTSDAYRARLKETRAKQKELVRADPMEGSALHRAASAPQGWTVDGSAAKGKKMVKEHVNLMLRAFNGESDAAIAKLKYNNLGKSEERIRRAFEAINKLGQAKRIELTHVYLSTKLEELYLAHELAEKRQAEKEEERRIREEMREEQKAQKEIDKATSEAEKDEIKTSAALEKARTELSAAQGRHVAKLEELVAKLESELGAAIDRKAKAIARAQLTRSGHVYVLSNVGSFGKGVYKIGMTRRLEPLERVNELGDASVPFRFDVHAMIYAEDAPGLENRLHKHFDERRVNKVNLRREYFRVTLEEVRQAVAKHHGIITFVTEPPAEEYRTTLALEAEAARAQRTAT